MKYLALAIVLTCTLGCQAIKEAGHDLCRVKDKVSTGVSSVGNALGPIGSLVSGVLVIGLDAFCGIIEKITETPAALGDSISGEEETPEG